MKGWGLMIDTRKRRAVVFLMFLLLFAAFVTLTMLDQRQRCLEVEILTQQEPDWLQEYQYRDYSGYLLYNGQKAPIDTETSTIYIAQDIRQGTKPEELSPRLFRFFHAPLLWKSPCAFPKLVVKYLSVCLIAIFLS